MSDEQFQPVHIPDYQRLCRMSKKVPELEPDDIMLYGLLRAIGDEMAAQLKASLDRYGITEGRLRVLVTLLDPDGAASHTELARSSGVTKGTITGLVDSLERDGFVRRSASVEDRRVCRIEITDEGERLLKRILPGHIQRLKDLIGVISKEDQKRLLKLLQKYRAGLFGVSRDEESEAVE
ncbi:MAG: MarR family winged helix-turn-helix transcriptional regulator [Phycisphaerales bacterium JB059]